MVLYHLILSPWLRVSLLKALVSSDAFGRQAPGGAFFADVPSFSEPGEVVSDRPFASADQFRNNQMRSGGNTLSDPHIKAIQNQMTSVAGDFAARHLETVFGETVRKFTRLAAAQLVDAPFIARAPVANHSRDLVDSARNLIDVLVARGGLQALTGVFAAGRVMQPEEGAVAPYEGLQQAHQGADGANAKVDPGQLKDGLEAVDNDQRVAAGLQLIPEL